MDYDFAILILYYKKDIYESKTLNSLLASLKPETNCQIVLWNNGPKEFSEQATHSVNEAPFDIKIVETLNNIKLSSVYNRFSSMVRASVFVYLDDDSVVGENYLVSLLKTDSSSIGVPFIKSYNKIEAPKVNGKVIGEDYKVLKDDDFILSIGSGLAVGCKKLEAIKSKFGDIFDEKFYLYGIDTTFFYRIKQLNFNKDIQLLSYIEHSLSRLETEEKAVTDFRKKERCYDVGLQWRYYFPLAKSLYYILRLAYQTISSKDVQKLKYTSLAFFTGKHYRERA